MLISSKLSGVAWAYCFRHLDRGIYIGRQSSDLDIESGQREYSSHVDSVVRGVLA